MTDDDIIEAIARRWFDTLPATQQPSWDAQPEPIKEQFRERARRFWRKPSRMDDLVKTVGTWIRQGLSEIDKATG